MRSEPSPSLLLPFTALIVASAATGLLYSVDASNGHNALELPAQDVATIATIAPQSWGFFTRDPQATTTYVLQRNDGHWAPPGLTSSAEPRYLFGFVRAPRTRGVELGLLAQGLDNDDFHRCKRSAAQCLEQLDTVVDVVNPSPNPSLCGDVAVVRQAPVPYAWSTDDAVVMPSAVVRLAVQC